MALPSSGPLKFSQIATEFDSNNPIRLSQYYRDGGLVPNAPANSNIPLSGDITVSDFYGATNEIVVTLDDTVTPYEFVDVKDLFDAIDPAIWASGVPMRVQVDTGVTVGSDIAATPAMTVPTGAGREVSIDNSGQIYGGGGVGGNGAAGGPGGNALAILSPTTINNTGQFYGGGGGGGAGGVGGSGSCGPSFGPQPQCPGRPNPFACGGGSCAQGGYQGETCFNNPAQCPVPGRWCIARCSPYPCGSPPAYPNPPVSGGTGGNGGGGRGYTQSIGTGTAGSQGPVCSGPSGRTGGEGGDGADGSDWGTAGNAGDDGLNGNQGTGGSGLSGGNRGSSVDGDSLVTWVAFGDLFGPRTN